MTKPTTAGLPLFSQPVAPYRDTETSLRAAVRVTPTLNVLRLRVLQAIQSFGPMTRDECAERLQEHVLTIRPRFTELSGAKYGMFYLEATGEQRPSALGNPMDVFRLTKAGEKALNDSVDAFHAPTVAAQSTAA
jgi:predicted ArsR family transcriptional regulator